MHPVEMTMNVVIAYHIQTVGLFRSYWICFSDGYQLEFIRRSREAVVGAGRIRVSEGVNIFGLGLQSRHRRALGLWRPLSLAMQEGAQLAPRGGQGTLHPALVLWGTADIRQLRDAIVPGRDHPCLSMLAYCVNTTSSSLNTFTL